MAEEVDGAEESMMFDCPMFECCDEESEVTFAAEVVLERVVICDIVQSVIK